MATLDAPARLAALERWGLRDNGREEAFDRCARRARELLRTRVGLVSLVDDRCQRFKGAAGLDLDGTPLSHSFCRHVVEDEAPLVIPDARRDERLRCSPAITQLGMVAYCGVPLRDHDGHALGALCVIANQPRRWTGRDVRLLQLLAQTVIAEIELRAANRALAAAQHQPQPLADAPRHLPQPLAPLLEKSDAIIGASFNFNARELTERHLPKLELTAPQERWRLALDGAPIGMALLAPDGRWLRVNRALCRIFGYSAEEMRAMSIQQLADPVTLKADMALVQSVLNGQAADFHIERRYRHRDGHPVWIKLSAWLVRDQHGEPLHFVAQIEDITERLERERQNRRLATIVAQSTDAIIAVDRAGTITDWNLAAEHLYGRSAELAVGSSVAMLVGPQGAAEQQALLERVLAGHAVRSHRTTHVHRDGRPLGVAVSLSPLRDSTGAVEGASLIVRDISARVADERARRAVEERLRVTVQHAPIGVGLLAFGGDGHGRLVSANRALADLFGVADEKRCEGVQLSSYVNGQDCRTLQAALCRLASHPEATVQFEVRSRRDDAAWLLMAGAAVPSEEGLPRQAVLYVIDIAERKRYEAKLQRLAEHDPLTGLFNRHRFEAELQRAIDHAARCHDRGALLVIDLDGFKTVNDTMGHSQGDRLVAIVGKLLAAAVRKTDVVARIGGDEFAVIVAHADEREGLEIATKLLSTLRDKAVVLADRRSVRVTCSIGLATFDGECEECSEKLLAHADIAMYQAKEAGKNRVCVYRPEDRAIDRIRRRESWLQQLRSAVDHEAFALLAQPICPLRTKDIDRYELLLRMRGERGRLVAPALFMDDVERLDLIQRIDRWVFAQAARLLHDYHAAGRQLALCVNVSAKTLGDAAILDDLAALLTATPVPPRRLVVEVTETAAITNIGRAREVARGLRELGCEFALDDFGCGFASFYYLKHLDFDYLKIDGEFVASMLDNHTDQLVIRAVVQLARDLGARTIAECVADGDSLMRLRELGVDYGQGYHLGRPRALERVLPTPIAAA